MHDAREKVDLGKGLNKCKTKETSARKKKCRNFNQKVKRKFDTILRRKKEQMEKRALIKDSPVNEKLLFHGTDAQNVDNICEENIDCRAPDEDRAAQFGQGAYFTEEAALSNLYCRQDSESFRYMFLAEVLVGASAKGEPSMRRPPVKSESEANKKERYDSCVDNVFKPTIFVLFDSDQYYPSFLIKYKTKSKVVC